MRVLVKFFASVEEMVGCSETWVLLDPPATVADLQRQLEDLFPVLRNIRNALVFAVNQEYAYPETALAEGDEVALIPPISGGCSLYG
jgi:molybdopterin converting factor subunit 1